MCAALDVITLAAVIGAAVGCGDNIGYWQAQAAEEVRELDMLADVTVVETSREEFAARAAERAARMDDEVLRHYAETYGRLGYFDMSLDLRPIVAGSSSDWVGATYSFSSKSVTVVGETRDHILVHEFVHALQDQHFDLSAYESYASSDAFLARRAVVEGDATLAQYRFLAHEDGGELDTIDWLALFDSWRGFSREMLMSSDYPVLFLDYVSFTYAYGLELAAANLTGVSYAQPHTARAAPHDWRLQDQLFTERPPATTQQILALDTSGTASDEIIEIGLRRLPEAVADRLTLVDWDSLGQWYVYLLLFPLERDGVLAGAAGLAAAWDGDSALFAVDRDTARIASIWASAWDTDADAAAVVSAMAALYGIAEPTPGGLVRAADGELVWLERRGHLVVIIKNLAADLVPVIVDAAFAPDPGTSARKRPSLGAWLARIRGRTDCTARAPWRALEGTSSALTLPRRNETLIH